MRTLVLKKGFWRNLVLFTTLSFTTVIFGKTGLVDNNLDYLSASPTIYSDGADHYPGDSMLITAANGLSSGLHEKLNYTTANKRTATDLSSGTNPSDCGGSVAFTATVRNIESGSNPTCGSVTFYDGAISIGTVALTNSNVATLTINSLSPGATHSITAVYSPSANGCNFIGSTSPALLQVVHAPAIAVFSTPSADITVSCGAIPATSSLSYTNGLTGLCGISGSVTSAQTAAPGACGGTITETWSFTDAFGRTITEDRTITVTPARLPTMTALGNITVACGAIPASSTISFSNQLSGGCLISGTSNPSTFTATPGACGGTVTETWTATDSCNRALASVSRTITVSPAALPKMTAPEDITVACGALPASSTISFSNQLSGGCLISGTSNPSTFTATPGACGGTVTETWTATDSCNRALASVSRTITVSPAALPTMTAPEDITVACGAIPGSSTISFSNQLSGGCLISGTSNPSTFTETPGACGGTVTETWTATDSCNRALASVSRTITVSPAALPTMTALSDITVACGDLPASSTISFSNQLSGGCLISGTSNSSTFTVTPGACGGIVTETWTAPDSCGRPVVSVSRVITVSPTTEASFEAVSDITVACGAATTSALGYTNGKTGNCEISGSVMSTLSVQDPAGYCGGDITESWTYTDSCDRTIMASRIIHVRPILVASEGVPCSPGNDGIPKVYLCHKTGSTRNPCINICVDQSAVAAHLAHGDYIGECAPNCENPNARPAKQVYEENVTLFNVKAYPNPSNNQFTFEIESESSGDIKIRVLDISGRLIKEMTDVKESKVTFGESLQRGVYIAIVQQGNNQQTIRIVKK